MNFLCLPPLSLMNSSSKYLPGHSNVSGLALPVFKQDSSNQENKKCQLRVKAACLLDTP